MKNPIPWGRSLLLGILTVVGLALCTPLWMASQMGRPVDFTYFLIGIGAPALLLALFVVKTRTVAAAVVCGFLFSAPVAVFCWALPALDPKLDYFKDMRGDGVFVIIASVILMNFATFQRQLNQSPPEGEHKPDED